MFLTIVCLLSIQMVIPQSTNPFLHADFGTTESFWEVCWYLNHFQCCDYIIVTLNIAVVQIHGQTKEWYSKILMKLFQVRSSEVLSFCTHHILKCTHSYFLRLPITTQWLQAWYYISHFSTVSMDGGMKLLVTFLCLSGAMQQDSFFL